MPCILAKENPNDHEGRGAGTAEVISDGVEWNDIKDLPADIAAVLYAVRIEPAALPAVKELISRTAGFCASVTYQLSDSTGGGTKSKSNRVSCPEGLASSPNVLPLAPAANRVK